jgi:hypothetical protein
MRTKLLATFLTLFAAPLWILASDPSAPISPADSNLTNWLVVIIPLAVPVIVAILKQWINNLPTWSIPIFAALLGELLNLLSLLAGGPSVGPLAGVALGASGVGVREIYDQLKTRAIEAKATSDMKRMVAATMIIFAVAVAAPTVMTTGCVTPTSTRAKVFLTLKDTWTVVDKAMNVYAEQVVRGKVSKEAEAKADAAYDNFRAAWRVAVRSTGTDNVVTPDNVKALADALLNILKAI